MVGRTMLRVLEEEGIVAEYHLFASPAEVGDKVRFAGKDYVIRELSRKAIRELKPDFALLAAGGDLSAEYAPIIVKVGGIAIDNSSYFRMHNDVPLVVPEVNSQVLKKKTGIIANPNCSTIQSVVPLKPLDDAFGLKRVVYSTYQAASGAGINGVADLERGARGETNKHFTYQLFNNLIPQIDEFLENGNTKEEEKMILETKKILGKPELAVTATAVRVPVKNCHSVSINAEFEKPFTLDWARKILESAPGVIVVDDTAKKQYPMPILADDRNPVFVGRIRMDESRPNTLNMFVVADNVRKGAATNAVQILKFLIT